MTALYTQQHRVLTTRETSAKDPLSVRFCIDAERNLNNYKGHVGAHKIISEWGVPADKWISADSVTTETVVHVFAPRYIPDGYQRLWWTLCGVRTTGAGSTVFRLYSSPVQYKGPAAFDDSYLFQGWSVDDLTIDSATHQAPTSDDLEIMRNASDDTWLILTAANSNNTTRARVCNLDVTPFIP